MTCPPVGTIQNGKPNSSLAIFGSVVLFTCDEGFWFSNIQESSLVSKCLNTREWSRGIPDCQR